MPRINLLPWREEQRALKQRQFMIMLAAGAIASALLVGFTHIQMESMKASQNSRNRFLEDQIKIVEKQIKEIEDLKEQKKALLARLEVIQSLQGSRPEVVHLFEEMAQATPKGVFLLSADRKKNNVVLTGVADSNDSVSAYMRNLDASDWLANPVLKLIDHRKSQYPGSSWFSLDVEQTLAPTEEETNKAAPKGKKK